MAVGSSSDPSRERVWLENNGLNQPSTDSQNITDEELQILLDGRDLSPVERNHNLLMFGICCFNQFLQSNWTGPDLKETIIPLSEEYERLASDYLHIDGEQVYVECRNKVLLLLTIRIFDSLKDFSSSGVWRARAYFVWQRVMADSNDRGQGHCPSLMQVCLNDYCEALAREGYIPDDVAKNTLSHLPSARPSSFLALLPVSSITKELQAELILELIMRLAYYNKVQLINPLLDSVSSILGINVEVTGVEGVRREHQTVSFAQLVARVSRNSPSESPIPIATVPAPKALNLVDFDTTTDVYETVQLSDTVTDQDELTSALSAMEQCVVIAEALRHFYSGNTRDELNLESVHALAMRIISTCSDSPASWIAFSMCLLLRSRSEFFRNTTRGRACFQIDALVDQFKDTEPCPSIRLRHIHCTGYPSVWELQRENGMRMMEVGMVVTACEMFKKLKMWPLAMDCLAVAGKKQEALELLDSLEPLSARLLCSKGDMTGEIEYYEAAWEKSGHRNARAMRSIGRMKLKNQDLDGATQAFELSLDINPLFDDIWYTLGCAYLKMDELDKAINALVRCVGVNPEHVQGWVNLSAVYSSPEFGLEFIQEAKNAASEAVKLSSQAWQFWENYTLISAKANDWQNVINGERKLSLVLERPDHPDLSMLELVKARAEDKGTRTRFMSLLEDLVLRNKQSSDTLRLLGDMYREFGRFEECFKTQTARLKELFSLMQDVDATNRATGKTAQNLLDEIAGTLVQINELLSEESLRKAEGLTTGLALTVRSIPRRVNALNNGTELPKLKLICDQILAQVRERDSLAE